MNTTILKPLKIFIINPLSPATQLFIVKLMSGVVFGNDQLIDLNLIVYSNDMKPAEAFMLELESCVFACTNSIKVSSDLPRVTDGDIFCFMSDLVNPNFIKFDKEIMDDQFNALYLIIKVANSFSWSDVVDTTETKSVNCEKNAKNHGKLPKIYASHENKPIFVADGIVTLDILCSLSTNIPAEVFFCPTPVTAVAKSVLGDYLNVHCNTINNVHVWAANDNVFHVEVEKPLITYDDVTDGLHCAPDKVIGKDLLESMNLDSTQFSASWLKKDFIEKVASSVSKNPYGCIYRAVEFSKTLRDIWLTRIHDDGKKVYNNMGVISDGSLGTIKGHAYVLPIIFSNGSWSVNKCYEDDIHLKQEVKRINNEVIRQHDQMISYCKMFLQENIINQPFVDEDGSSYTSKY